MRIARARFLSEPRYLKLVTVSSFCPFTLISVLVPLVLFVISVVFSALVSMPYAVEALRRRSTNFANEDLLTIVKRRKLQWYGHVSRSSGLAKTILQSTVKGRRRQDRQRKRWEDNIREWTGLGFAKSQRAVKNREKWRKLVVKSSMMPRRPSRLRHR